MERPQVSAVTSIMAELRASLDKVAETQRKVFEVTGTAWSEDRMVKAVVGPRGQLIELEIDPRIYRKPNSKALAASILATVRAAVEQAVAKTEEILAENLPKDTIGGTRPGALDMRRLIRSHDADLKKNFEEVDDADVP